MSDEDKKSTPHLDTVDHQALILADERLARLRLEAELLLERSGLALKIRTADLVRQSIADRMASEYGASGFNIDDGTVTRNAQA